MNQSEKQSERFTQQIVPDGNNQFLPDRLLFHLKLQLHVNEGTVMCPISNLRSQTDLKRCFFTHFIKLKLSYSFLAKSVSRPGRSRL